MRDKQLHRIFSAPVNYHASHFFSTPELSQRLSLIRHLLQYSEQLLLLMAEKGSGKTFLLEQLRGQPDEQWHLFYLQGEPDLPEQSVLQQLLNSLSVNTDGKQRDDLRNSLRSHISALRYNGELPVLLVDDAHMLPLDSLQLLMELSMRGEMQTRLRILLSCEPQMTSLFSAPEFAIVQQTLIHTLDIPAFSPTQAHAYLDFRLKQGRYVGEPAFTDLQRHQFYQKSRGLPAGLNAAVLQQLKPQVQKPLLKPRKKIASKDMNKRGRVLLLGAIALVVLLSILQIIKSLWFPVDETVLQTLKPPITPRYTTNLNLDLPDLQSRLPITDPITNTELPMLDETDVMRAQSEPIEDIDTTEMPISSGIEGAQSSEWLSRQPDTFYTIQIISAYEQDTLSKLLQQQSLDVSVPVAMFKTTRDQRTWYVLTYGIYQNQALAKQALSTLPQTLQNTGPWIRPLADIHLLIEQQALSDGN